MLPRLSPPRSWKITALATAAAVCGPVAFAQQDTAPVDPGQMLKALHTLLDQQSGKIKTEKGAAVQQIAAAASSPDKAIALWQEGVRMTQFEGAGHESTQFQAWKATDGEAFKEREVQNALRLYFTWLQLTVQRSSGAKLKDMLPAIINYTKDLAADEAAMAALEEAVKREKDMNAGKAPMRGGKPKGNEALVKKTHDGILKRPLAGSIYVQWQRLQDWVNVEKWEGNPGSFDGIYDNIVLPEMRDQRDPRLMEYWDMMLKKAADEANRTRLAFDIDKYNNLVVPTLLWGRASDMIILGQKNRALTDMFSLIKKYPTHPESRDWISQLETLLAPPAPPTTATAPTAPGAAATPSAIPAPAPTAEAPR